MICFISAHPPEFYDGVAENLDRIAQKHSVKKKSPVKPEPVPSTLKGTCKPINQTCCFKILILILMCAVDALSVSKKEKLNTMSSPLTIAYCYGGLMFFDFGQVLFWILCYTSSFHRRQ